MGAYWATGTCPFVSSAFDPCVVRSERDLREDLNRKRHRYFKNHTGSLRPKTTHAMSDSEIPTEGPISLQEFEKRLTGGQITKNTRVRMPDGQEWMLLPSCMRSEPVSTVPGRQLARLRRETAYGWARWLVRIVAWLCYLPALALVFVKPFLSGLFRGVEAGAPDFAARFGCAFLLWLAGQLVQCGGAMLVDLFDLLLATHISRSDRSENNQGSAVHWTR